MRFHTLLPIISILFSTSTIKANDYFDISQNDIQESNDRMYKITKSNQSKKPKRKRVNNNNTKQSIYETKSNSKSHKRKVKKRRKRKVISKDNIQKDKRISKDNENIQSFQEERILLTSTDNPNISMKSIPKLETMENNQDYQFHKHRQMFHQHEQEKQKQQQQQLLKQLQMNRTEFENLDKKPYMNVNVPKPKLTTSATTTLWIQNYLSNNRREHLLPVPRDFIVDGFNLQKLQNIVELHTSLPYETFRAALRLILDQEINQPSINLDEVQNVAKNILYPLLHARFIVSPRGLGAVNRALKQNDELFGRCPRLQCNGMPLLPCGLSDQDIGRGNSMRYCCSCGETFHVWDSKVDGCAWGTSFCHLLLMVYGKSLFPNATIWNTSKKYDFSKEQFHTKQDTKTFTTPRIFGFRVHPVRLSKSEKIIEIKQ